MKMTAEQKVERAHVALMRDPKFCLFSGLFMVGNVEVRDDVPTARTDGINVQYGRAFVERLDDKQVGFIVLHETMHKAYRHLTVWKNLYKENARLANMACDYVINLQIFDYDPKEQVVRMPTDEEGEVIGLIDESFRGMDAKQVFDALKQKERERNENGGNEGGNGNKTAPSGNVQMDEHDWEGAQEITQEKLKEIESEIDNALRQGALLAGKLGGKVSREISELLTPEVDWRDALRDLVKALIKGNDDSTWRRYNRRLLGSDIYMPSSYSMKMKNIGLGVDTSGSIGGSTFNKFLSEIVSICNEVVPDRVDLIYWDADIQRCEKYEGSEVNNLASSTKPRGGGGTRAEVVPKHIKNNNMEFDCFIQFTDGIFNSQGNWSGIDAPLIWCVVDNKQFKPKHGIAIHIKEYE